MALQVLEDGPRRLRSNGYTDATYIVKCECGNVFITYQGAVKAGKTKSCGCLARKATRERMTTHGLSSKKNPLYRLWAAIKDRCYYSDSINYENYGGRGITMCREWLNDFKAFSDWCISNGWKKGLQIDRIDNDGNYTPHNCRFVDRSTNARNRRSNHYITYRGQTKLMVEWSEELNLPYNIIQNRINTYGWPIEKVFEQPIRFSPKRKTA